MLWFSRFTVALAVVAGVPVPAAAAQPDVDAIVVLKDRPDLSGLPSGREARLSAVVRRLRVHADSTQQGVRTLLGLRQRQGQVATFTPLWIDNAVAVRATPAVIREIARRPDVAEVRPDTTIQAPAAAGGTSSVEPNLSVINAPALWDKGFRGQDVVVANLDTGVDVTHPDLANHWRGGTNSWYDPNGQHSSPADVNGHGTQTMGVLTGATTGVAPDAKWIAVKIFNDRGSASTSAIHLGFQWLLDPDGNPATPDAPNVVNASWTSAGAGCVLDFQPDLRSLRAAGILPVFAAGNYGPTSGTVYSPANLPEAFAVGDTDNSDALDLYSSRGPSACAGAVAPKLVAPGVDIRTTDLYGSYLSDTGTSVAAPHVAGTLALLLNAFPGISADRQEAALLSGAHPLGAPSDFGSGRLDALAAYQWLVNAPDFTMTVSPSSVTIPPGGTASYDVSVTPVNGFTGDVSLSLTGLPNWTFTPPVIPGGSGTSRLTVTSDSAGPHPFTFTGTSGSVVRRTSADLTVQAPPDFSVGVTPSSQSVASGTSAVYTVSVGSLNGFTGSVALSLSGLSSGSASFTPSSVTGAGNAQLTITSAPPGTYSLTITGASGGVSHAVSATLTVFVRDFTLSASPASITVSRGQTAAYTLSTSAIGGFTGTVTLSSTGAPYGSTSSFTTNPITTPGSSTLRVRTTGSTSRGTYTIRVTGTSGSSAHQSTVTLVVH